MLRRLSGRLTGRLTGRVSAVVGVLALATACTATPAVGPSPYASRPLPHVPQSAVPVQQVSNKSPNIVFVLMDDFSMDLVPTLKHARTMTRLGASYQNAFVVDSLCCVSRAATFTGQYPHQTGVLTNTANMPNRVGAMGGYRAFAAHGDEQRTFAVRLQQAGYTTGFVGKYLNQYEYYPAKGVPRPPLGWSDLRVVFGTAYDGWDYNATYTQDGQVRVQHYDAPAESEPDAVKDKAYAGTVIGNDALDFIHEHRHDTKPYFLEVAPYAPHGRINSNPAYAGDPMFPPAFRDRPGHGSAHGNCGPVDCQDLTVADLPGYDDWQGDNAPVRADGTLAPAWSRSGKGLSVADAETSMRDRARMAQSIDRMLGRILHSVDDNTYVVLTSDNGFHLGQHGLTRGKGTAYDTDVHVPLYVMGPGVVPGPRDGMVSNIDLAPTFEDLAGIGSPAYRSGHSFAPSFADPTRDTGDYAFFEHTWSQSPGNDPDRPFSGHDLDHIPSYVAVRSRTGLLIRDDLDYSYTGTDYAYEYYDYATEPWERRNLYGDPRYAAQVSELMAKLDEFDRCARGQALTPDVSDTCRALPFADKAAWEQRIPRHAVAHTSRSGSGKA